VQDLTNYRIKIYLLSVVSWNCALQAYLKYLPCYNCIIFRNNFLLNNYIFLTEEKTCLKIIKQRNSLSQSNRFEYIEIWLMDLKQIKIYLLPKTIQAKK